MIDKQNLNQTLDRLLAYAERRLGRGILASVDVPLPKEEFGGDKAEVRDCLLLSDLDRCVKSAETAINNFPRDLLSDSYPSTYPTLNFGESVWSGFFGAPITFSGTHTHTWSSCLTPSLENLEQFAFFPLDATSYYYRKMLDVTAQYVSNLPPKCDMTAFIFMDCLNLLVELRGAAEAYMDLYDHPTQVQQFMDWSVDVNCGFYDEQSKLLKEFTSKAFGGHPFYRYSSACIPNLSIDAYGVCAGDIYQKWGLEQHKRIVDRYGGARLHIHSDGRRHCELVAKIEAMTSCMMYDEPGYPPAWSVVKELKESMFPIPIEVNIPFDEFARQLRQRTLPSGVSYHTTAKSLAEANSIMEEVFGYQADE